MPKIYIVGGPDRAYEAMFVRAGWEVVRDVVVADALQFTGGEDVSPFLYGEEKHARTYNSPQRDLIEMGYYQLAQLLGKVCLGICRGGQFLNVMNGGKMWQHVNGHAIHGTHVAYELPRFIHKTHLIQEVQVTSTHHQMMRINKKVDHLPLVIAHEATRLENGSERIDAKDHDDIESVYYPNSKSLCFQPHPEFPGYQECTDLYFRLINRCVGL